MDPGLVFVNKVLLEAAPAIICILSMAAFTLQRKCCSKRCLQMLKYLQEKENASPGLEEAK